MEGRQLYLIGYDVSSNRRRARTLRTLKGHAIGGQKSVYECWLGEGELAHARDALLANIEPANDRLVLIRLDPRASILTLGTGVPPEDGAFFYHG